MTRRTTCAVAVGAVVALAPVAALANGGSGPQGDLVICHDDETITVPASQWWPYGYLGATKGACPEPSATPAATPAVTPEPSPTVTPTPYDGDYVPTGPTSGGYGIATATPTPVATPTPHPPTILPEPTPAPTAAPTPARTPVASSTAVVPRPANTGQGAADRAGGLRAALLAPTVAVALLFGGRATTRERGTR